MHVRAPRSLVALILAVTLTAMGFAAAVARGQTVVEGQVVVLCSGGGLIQLALDATGRPTGKSHLCPDLAASLLAAHALGPPVATRPETLAEAPVPAGVRLSVFVIREASPARGPPAVA